jgi:hypothetical protein
MLKLLDWANEMQLNPEELRNETRLSKNHVDQMAWHMAVGESDEVL